MRKLLLVLVLLAAGVAVWAAQGGALSLPGSDGELRMPWSADDTRPPAETAGTNAAGTEAAGTDAADTEAASLARPADATAVTIDYVHDGDTLFVVAASGERLTVRLIGVDTPEVGDAAECFGAEATDHLRALLPVGSAAWVTPDEEALDPYGRSLLYLWAADGSFTNLGLVAGGYGTALRIDPNDAYWPQLSDAEAGARNAGLGLWGEC